MKKLYVCPRYPGGLGHWLLVPTLSDDVDPVRDASSEGSSPELWVRRFGAGRMTIRTSPSPGDVAALLPLAAGAGRTSLLRVGSERTLPPADVVP